ncbi:MAG: hypothetical protein AB7V42_06280 [Thermoleophilia bacterium]
MVGCATAILLTAATGAFATNTHHNKGKNARCVAGGCPAPQPFGRPLGTNYLTTSVLALPSPPKTKEEVFYSHATPVGAASAHPTIPAVFGEGSDIFGLSSGSGLASWPADLQPLTGLPGAGMFLFLLRDANDTPIGFGVEQEMHPAAESGNNTFASDWIVSIPGRGVLWLNSNDNTGSPDLPTFTRPDGSVVTQSTTGPAKAGAVNDAEDKAFQKLGRGVIVGGSGEFAGRTGTWVEYDIKKAGYPQALGTFNFEMHVYWDQKPTSK